jgi:DNA-binding response OmpR family regulator
LIETDGITLELYQRELRKSFTVFGFTGTENVLETIANQDVRAVVVDPGIQGGKGWDLIQDIKSRFPARHIPIVVCSTLDPGNTRKDVKVTKYLTKPVLPIALRERILEVIEKQKAAETPHD